MQRNRNPSNMFLQEKIMCSKSTAHLKRGLPLAMLAQVWQDNGILNSVKGGFMRQLIVFMLMIFAALAGCASAVPEKNEPAARPAAKEAPPKTQKQIDAEKKGILRAQEDIRRGVFHILICGERIPGEKPQRDAETGYIEYNEEGDDIPYIEYFCEMDGYNATMREYAKTHRKDAKTPK